MAIPPLEAYKPISRAPLDHRHTWLVLCIHSQILGRSPLARATDLKMLLNQGWWLVDFPEMA